MENEEIIVTIENESTIDNSPDAEEQKAMQGGWVPQDQWKGDPKLWRPAKEFNERGELLSHIKKLNKESADMKRAIAALGEINRKTAEIEREKALNELKQMRKEAFQRNDIDTADELTDKIAELKQLPEEEVIQEAPAQQPNEVFVAWVENNSWYLENKVLQGAANSIAQELLETDEAARADQRYLLREVEKRMKQEFPAKFNQAKSKVADAGSDTGRSGQRSSLKLSEEEANVGKMLVKCGAFPSLEAYAKSLQATKG